MNASGLRLRVLPGDFAACRLPAGAPLPSWANANRSAALFSVTRTGDELSLLVARDLVPADVACQAPFRALVVEGPLPFDAVGILAGLSGTLAAAGIPLLAISTYDTDYVLVKADVLDPTLAALHGAGYRLEE